MKNKRIIYYDLLRILACFLVIVNHTAKDVFYWYLPNASEIISIFYFMFSKIAVPLFLMISGALLLKKNYDYKHIMVHKFGKTFLAIYLFSAYLFVFFEHRPLNPLGWLSSIIQEPAFTAFWYLYALLGIYLVLPFLQLLAQSMNKKQFHIFFSIWFILYGLIPFFQDMGFFPPYTYLFKMPLITSEVGYLFLGYYLTKDEYHPVPYKNSHLILTFLATLFFASLFTIWEFYHYGLFRLTLDRNFIFTSIIMGTTVFLLMKNLDLKLHFSEKNLKIIHFFAESTYGIYLVHGIVMAYLADFQQMTLGSMNRLIALLINEALIFIFSLLIIRLLFLIPGMRWLLNAPKIKHTS